MAMASGEKDIREPLLPASATPSSEIDEERAYDSDEKDIREPLLPASATPSSEIDEERAYDSDEKVIISVSNDDDSDVTEDDGPAIFLVAETLALHRPRISHVYCFPRPWEP
ncbi:hypothetical protein HPP92_021243 [Vanilla planifolia]|uniref:Uncharacterized protein n=1 Tax=Vanilla planifolia TaxID=51239 RepID=A0A835UIS6_VANPL|nr:hypothetical protein HPP92_021243 [Vanilla planifolia]